MRPETVRSAQTSFPCSSPSRSRHVRRGQRGHASARACFPLAGLAVGLAAGLGLGVTTSHLTGDDSQPPPASTDTEARGEPTRGADRADRSHRASRSGSRASRPRTFTQDATVRRAHVPAQVASLNWDALAACESDGDQQAVSPEGYSGLYQFDEATWRQVGGQGAPHEAGPDEQTYRAQLLFVRSGSQPWPSCGHLL